jgi:nicotinamide-nucleotide amidase
MIVEIITIGDELLRGEIVDSNKAFLSDRLLDLGIECHYHTSVRDTAEDMSDAFLRAVSRCDVVLVSGGLGPTRDDLTAAVLARTLGREMLLDEASLETIREFFRRLGREMSENNAKQAYFPSGAEVLDNPVGTAPGFAIEQDGALIFCLPGVPREMKRMMDDQVLPRLVAREAALEKGRRGSGNGSASGAGALAVPARPALRCALLRTFGMGESALDHELADIGVGQGVELGFRTSFPDNYLRPTARAATAEEAEARLAGLCRAIRERLGSLVYGEGDESMEWVVGQLLRERGKTLCVAESCTGGLIAERITEVSGSSDYFSGGVAAYSNASKTALLGVSEALLREHGAVSGPVAAVMAEGGRARFGSDVAISTTGISGPGGGTEEKPVGLVFVALADDQGTHTERFVFPLDRHRHRILTAQVALDWVRRRLLGVELVGPSLIQRRGGSSPSRRASTPGEASP